LSDLGLFCRGIGVETPGEGYDSGEEDDGAESNEDRVEDGETGALSEVDQAVQNRNDVVDAEDERVEHRCRDELETSVKIVELSEGKRDEEEKEKPGRKSVELIRMCK
jgi:hypothetical protein